MLDYARRLRSAVSDTGRRAGLKAAAGILGAVAAGFLVAALWTFLRHHAGLGSLGASLVVALLFAVGAGVLWMMGSKVRHPVPSTDELKREVEARARLAADAAVEKARLTAVQVVDHAEAKAQAVVDAAAQKVHGLADTAEAKVHGFAAKAEAKVHGLTGGVATGADAGLAAVSRLVRDAKASPTATAMALAVFGVAAFSALRDRHDD